MSESFIVFVGLPVGTFAVLAGLSFWFGRLRTRVGIGLVIALLLVFTGTMFFGLETATGLDGLGFLFGLMFLALPAGLGALTGGLFGWQRKVDILHA